MARTDLTRRGTVAYKPAGSIPAVEFSRPSGCGSCGLAGNCGSRLLQTDAAVTLDLPFAAQAGQGCEASVSGPRLLEWVAAAYLLIPLGLCLGAAVAVCWVDNTDAMALAGSLCGGWLGYMGLRLYHSRRAEGSVLAGLRLQLDNSGRR